MTEPTQDPPLCATSVVRNRSSHFAKGWYFEIETDPAEGDWDLIGPFSTRDAAEQRRGQMINGAR